MTTETSSSHITIISSSSDSTCRIQSRSSKSVSKWQTLLWLGNLVYYQLVAIVSVIIFWPIFETATLGALFTWHMILCAGAYMPLMAIAIISFSTDNLPTLHVRREKIYWVHGILLGISCLSVTVGISFEIRNKVNKGFEHFKSNHAILGLTSWILVMISVLIGLVSAKSQIFIKYIRPIVTKFFHTFFGISAFILGMSALMLKFPRLEENLWTSAYNGFFWATIYIEIWTLLAALKSLYFQAKGILM